VIEQHEWMPLMIDRRSPVRNQFGRSIRQYVFTVTPSEVFAAATIELSTRLWVELDTVHSAREAMEEAVKSPPLLATRLEALRLELLVLLDHCATRWTTHLDHWQRGWLVSMIGDVLAALNDSADEWPSDESLERAQNRLLEAILEQYADHGHSVAGVSLYATS
jgi:hypothetical protein